MKASTYHANGKGHWLLERLVNGPVERDELLVEGELAGHRKIVYVIAAMQTDGFIVHRSRAYALTDTGVAALDRLRAGRAVAGPVAEVRTSVRIFDRQVAA
jgi:hypothetical protein